MCMLRVLFYYFHTDTPCTHLYTCTPIRFQKVYRCTECVNHFTCYLSLCVCVCFVFCVCVCMYDL